MLRRADLDFSSDIFSFYSGFLGNGSPAHQHLCRDSPKTLLIKIAKVLDISALTLSFCRTRVHLVRKENSFHLLSPLS